MSARSVVRWVARRALRWFYREVSVTGAENMPATGAVLLIGNHPNDLPDILLGLTATSRPVRYVANAAAARSPMVALIYDTMRVIPVMRVRDARQMRDRGLDMMAENARSFDAVRSAFVGGDVIGLFPEGGVHAGPDLGRIRSGVAIVALKSAQDGVLSSIKIVPVGVQYEAAPEVGSDALVVFGEAIELTEWAPAFGERPSSAFAAMLRQALESVSRTALTQADAMQRDRLLAALSGAMASDGDGETAMARAHSLRAAWPALRAHHAACEAAAAIGAAVSRGGGRAESARDCTLLGAEVAGKPRPLHWRALLLAPASIIGLALHAPVFAAVRSLARRTAEVPTDLAAKAIVPGLYLIFVWYAILALVTSLALRAGRSSAHPWLSVLLVIPFVLLLPWLGDAAVYGRRAWLAFRFERRVRRWSDSERTAIRTSMITLRAAWLSYRDGSAVSAFAGELA